MMNPGNLYLFLGLILFIISIIISRKKSLGMVKAFLTIALQILPVIIFIFFLMGLIQAFVSRESIASLLGGEAGFLGILLGEVIGSIALILPAAVFPFAGFLHDNLAGYGAIYAFVMSAILLGVSTLPIEIKFLGKKFTAMRYFITFCLIFLISILFLVLGKGGFI